MGEWTGLPIKLLDHGYVELIEPYGTGKLGKVDVEGTWLEEPDYEVGIIEAARQSTNKNFQGWEQDARLLTYLSEHRHATPFEFSGMIVEVQAPILVFREWHRHRTQSYNEMSARYTPLPPLYYVPTVERLMTPTDGPNKQSSRLEGSHQLMVSSAQDVQDLIRRSHDLLELHYTTMLNAGTPKELARVVMPVGHYTRMRANATLRNWLAFLTLRLDPAAQWEIREYARAIGECIAATFPRSWALFNAPSAYDRLVAAARALLEQGSAIHGDDLCDARVIDELREMLPS